MLGHRPEDGGAHCGSHLPGSVILTHVRSIALLTSPGGIYLDPTRLDSSLDGTRGGKGNCGFWKEPPSLWDGSAEVLEQEEGKGQQRRLCQLRGEVCMGTLPHSPHICIWNKELLGG